MYANILRNLFQGVTLTVEDLFFLESYQIENLPDRAPKPHLAVLLRDNPIIQRFFVAKCPSVSDFVTGLLSEKHPVENGKPADEIYGEVLWEIADLIIYNKYPEIYDERSGLDWEIDEITPPESLEDKVVVDAGAGPGRLAFLAAQFAATVFAVEPAQGFRRFIRNKARRKKVKNLFVTDGFLDAIPLPNDSADVLVTSNAIGWNLAGELPEIERVLKPNGCAVHLFRSTDNEDGKQLHDVLVSSDWNYACTDFQKTTGLKRKYHKVINTTAR